LLNHCPAKVCTFLLQTKLSRLFLKKNRKYFIFIKNEAVFKVGKDKKGKERNEKQRKYKVSLRKKAKRDLYITM
jgi:hypothetical protein